MFWTLSTFLYKRYAFFFLLITFFETADLTCIFHTSNHFNHGKTPFFSWIPFAAFFFILLVLFPQLKCLTPLCLWVESEYDVKPAKRNIWSSDVPKATHWARGTYVKIGRNLIRAAALRRACWHFQTPQALFIHVIILAHMDAILTAGFGNVDYATFPFVEGRRYFTDKLSGCVICRL